MGGDQQVGQKVDQLGIQNNFKITLQRNGISMMALFKWPPSDSETNLTDKRC
jgi:hypothetical protein